MYSAHTTINICVHVCRKPRVWDDQKAQTSIDYFCCESSIKLICVWLYMLDEDRWWCYSIFTIYKRNHIVQIRIRKRSFYDILVQNYEINMFAEFDTTFKQHNSFQNILLIERI